MVYTILFGAAKQCGKIEHNHSELPVDDVIDKAKQQCICNILKMTCAYFLWLSCRDFTPSKTVYTCIDCLLWS